MNTRLICAIGIGLVVSSFALNASGQTNGQSRQDTARPNIILILADDLGAAELGCYGSREHRTPNLDRLAAEGLRLDTFFATPLCTPTRMCLMTGQYGFRNGYLGMMNEPFLPPKESPQREIGNHFTIGDLMKSAGYTTALAGKWQLSGTIPTLIHDSGFDEYRMWAYKHNLPEGVEHTGRWENGKIGDKTSRYWHPSIVENGKYLPAKPGDYGPDLFLDFIIDFIGRHRERPFFVYHTSVLTHAPHEETPDPDHPGKRLPKGFKTNLEYLDHLMGRLRRSIEEMKLAQNTVIIFVGDNGTGGRGKNTVTELGVRVPFIVWGPGWVHPREEAAGALGDLTDIMPTLADLSGTKLPENDIFDGKSMMPLLRGETVRHRDWIYSFLEDGRILRDDRWLLEIPGKGQPERFFECGRSRNGKGYKQITPAENAEARSARERFAGILNTMPEPRPRAVAGSQVSDDQQTADRKTQRRILRRQELRQQFDKDGDGKLNDQEKKAFQQHLQDRQVSASRPAPAAIPPGVKRIADIPYAHVGSAPLLLDVFLPKEAKSPVPVIIWVHGGAWVTGNKEQCPVLSFASNGYAVVSINYRLTGTAQFPAQINDCKAAVRWIRAHAAEYGFDPDHIGACGGSAGGHLVALLGTTGGVKELEGNVGGNLEFSSRVQAVSDFCGPTDFVREEYVKESASTQPAILESALIKLIGGSWEEKREMARMASPIYFVSRDDPPFFIAHGDADRVIPMKHSQALYDKLKETGVKVALHVIKGGGHGIVAVPDTLKLATAFFDRHLKKVAPN